MLKNVKLINVYSCVCYNSCNLRGFVVSGRRRWFCSGATSIMNDDINIWHIRKWSGLSHISKLMQICKYCYILMRKWKHNYSVLKIYTMVRVCIHYFGFIWLKWCLKPGEWRLKRDTAVAYFDFSFQFLQNRS